MTEMLRAILTTEGHRRIIKQLQSDVFVLSNIVFAAYMTAYLSTNGSLIGQRAGYAWLAIVVIFSIYHFAMVMKRIFEGYGVTAIVCFLPVYALVNGLLLTTSLVLVSK